MTQLTRRFSVVGSRDEAVGLKIAFATDDGEFVNQHFGSSRSFVIYNITPDGSHIESIAEFGGIEDNQVDDKLIAKLEFLQDCIAVYCRACGASAIRQLLESQVQPLKVVEDTPIKALIKAFQRELQEGPSSWLARAINRQKSMGDCSSMEGHQDT
ncbi:NifB/NifX family molybdenum-iron cluster-binding protein [Teredinibacter turnerae]|uniref:NifB/NifX family molybdenum-iron cluster-binding protein n=1 Tax=Teredinibacter turnerae TaxID=2426 RepID=UPI0030D17145